jgi:N-acetyl-anhydromuramyl-L-alanine amidase AmpD
MRTINLIVIHCSATRCDKDFPVEALEACHRARGFNGIGYHYYITKDGQLHLTRSEEVQGAHAKRYNKNSIGICYEGGLDANGNPCDTRTEAQKVTMRQLLEELHEQFPKAVIAGHNVFNPTKACPCFNAMREYADLQPE